jgi:hypothetical protein
LGHFGLPHLEGKAAEISRFEDDSRKVITASIKDRKVALIVYSGWDRVDSLVHTDRNAEADESTVVFAYRKRTAKNPAMELMIAAFLHKTDDTDWTDEELSPVKEIRILDVTPVLSPLGASITLHDGSIREIYFAELDGNRRC